MHKKRDKFSGQQEATKFLINKTQVKIKVLNAAKITGM
jgi:hypothetical protein